MQKRLETFVEHAEQLQNDLSLRTETVKQPMAALSDSICEPLASIRASLRSQSFKDYIPTGATPRKRPYEYPNALPRTVKRDAIRFQTPGPKEVTTVQPSCEDELSSVHSPSGPSSKGPVYRDGTEDRSSTGSLVNTTSLREVNQNVRNRARANGSDHDSTVHCTPASLETRSLDNDQGPEKSASDDGQQPSLKRRRRFYAKDEKACRMAGQENLPLSPSNWG